MHDASDPQEQTLTADEMAGIDQLHKAVTALRNGDLVGLPTETVYGLAGDATNATAVANIFNAKGRPHFNPLICHVTGIDMADALAVMDPISRRLADAFWPGPLTLVLPKRPDAPLADLATAGLDTVALRAPGHPVAQSVIEAFGGPVAAPSANLSGKLSPTRAAHVAAGLGDQVAVILDGGPCSVGLESSIIRVLPDRLMMLRPGSITSTMLKKVSGLPVELSKGSGPITAPGQLQSHYAPDAIVRLNATAKQPGECLIGFGPMKADLTLSHSGDLVEAAANLFQILREADTRSDQIAVAPIPQDGLGLAINDRLIRAAAPRPKDTKGKN